MKLGIFLILLACCLYSTTARPNDIDSDISEENSQPEKAENNESEEPDDGDSQSESDFEIGDSDDDWLGDVVNTEHTENDAMDRISKKPLHELADLLYSDYRISKSKLIESFEQQDKFEITMLKNSTDMYKEICDYVKNTQLIDNNPRRDNKVMRYEVDEIFKVYRYEEVERFEPYEQNYNRQLLVHGTPILNLVSILENGLKMPAESRGGIFGKGIYFADAVSKSAQYCRTYNGFGVVLLCEVALGMIDIRYKSDNSPLKDRCESVQALGQYYPESHIQPDGLRIPNGVLLQRKETTGIQFNEFVVSDEARVKIRYIVKLKFNI